MAAGRLAGTLENHMADAQAETDAALVTRSRAGDTEAYGMLVSRYQGHVYGLAFSLVGDWADAQDIAQDTFIRAFSNLSQLRDPAKFAAWLRRVAFGVSMDWLRAHRPKTFAQLDGRVDPDTLQIPDFQAGPEEHAQRRELADAVLAAVASLPANYRVPLTMFHLDGLSYQKVADFLDIPLGTAKSMISRARTKLKAALPAAIAQEMSPTVQEVFDAHKLPDDFAAKVIENVPALGWGTGRECTFAGALAAAMSVTPYPCAYTQLMGWTALAFRVRWHHVSDEPKQRWCASCAVGEMEEEIDVAARATGWNLGVRVHADLAEVRSLVVASIDAGKPVVAYDDGLNMACLYGYGEGAKTYLYRNYSGSEEPWEQPADQASWLWIFLGEHNDPPPAAESVAAALKLAAHHWRRGTAKAGPSEYLYGRAAYDGWIADLSNVDGLDEKEAAKLFFVNWWAMNTLIDARAAAALFLREWAGLFDTAVADPIGRAADRYEKLAQFLGDRVYGVKDCFLGLCPGKSIDDWTDAVRKCEIELLTESRQMEQEAVDQIDAALAALDAG